MRYVEFVILDNENRFGYPLLMNLLSIYEKCLEFTEGRGGEENFQHLIEEVYGNFLEEMRKISDLIENSKRMNELLVNKIPSPLKFVDILKSSCKYALRKALIILSSISTLGNR